MNSPQTFVVFEDTSNTITKHDMQEFLKEIDSMSRNMDVSVAYDDNMEDKKKKKKTKSAQYWYQAFNRNKY